MNKLKSFIVLYNGKFIRAYEEPEVDKVIAELEELHKKEVGQLLIEITELKQKNDDSRYNIAVLRKDRSRQKYKRCLAMAMYCHNKREIYERDSYDWELEDDAKDTLRNKANIMRKWRNRWLEIAEKFKVAK